MSLTTEQWAGQLERWSTLPALGEVKLLCTVLASIITDEPSYAHSQQRTPYEGAPFNRSFEPYCRILALNPDFVRQQIARNRQFWVEAALREAALNAPEV